MAALSRIVTPLKALLPDLTDVPMSRQAVGAIVASVLFHLLLLLGSVAVSLFLPESKVKFRNQEVAMAVPPEPLEVVIQVPESVPEVVTPEELKARAERETIDSTGLAKSEEKPDVPLFESDQDMKAASQNDPTGDAPLPSMDGKALPFTNFTTQDVILGSATQPPAPEPAAEPAKPEPRASVDPKPLAEAPPESAEKTMEQPAEEPAPAEDKKPEELPEELPEVIKPEDSQIVMAEKITEPVTRVIPTKERIKKQRQEMARLATPSPRPEPVPEPAPETMPAPTSSAGFQAQQERTKIDGAISNRGPAAVDAVRTPLAVYKKQVNAAIGSRWYYYVKQRRDLIALGQAKLSYSITKDGRIVSVKVLENTSNAAFAMICQQSISEAEIGPPPEEAMAVMNDGRLEGDLTFTYYAGF